MRIAIVGSRGIPGNYGGFETCAEQLSTMLVERGHHVSVYCMRPYSKGTSRWYRGVRRLFLPTIPHKALEKIVFASLSLIHVTFSRANVVLILGVSGAPLALLPRLAGKKVFVNVDGLEWKRKKWGRLARVVLKQCERLAGIVANKVITDARCIQEYYLQTYGKPSAFIPYGADASHVPPGPTMEKYGLRPREYALYVSRLEPENNAHLVVDAFNRLESDLKLVVVGDAPYSSDYIRGLRSKSNGNVVFTGYVFGEGYRELQSNAYFYVQATEVGGTHPALVEAMAYGNCVLVSDVPEHREVAADAAVPFKNGSSTDLQQKMSFLLRHPGIVQDYRQRAVRRARERYRWEYVTDCHEHLFAHPNGRFSTPASDRGS